jgi:hypothetical protein
MSELSGVEAPEVDPFCGVCHADGNEEPQWQGVCADPFGCTNRYVGIQQRIALMRTGGVSGRELELRIQQEKESRDQ